MVVEVAPGFELNALTVERIASGRPGKSEVTFAPADPAKVLGKEGVALTVEVSMPLDELRTLLNAARFDAWLEDGGDPPEDL